MNASSTTSTPPRGAALGEREQGVLAVEAAVGIVGVGDDDEVGIADVVKRRAPPCTLCPASAAARASSP